MTVTRATLKILNSDVVFPDLLNSNISNGNSYKFFVPRNVDVCIFTLIITKSCDTCNDVHFLVQPHSLPTSKNYLHSSIINSSQTGDGVIEFYPHENSWHYVDLKFFEQITNEPSQKSNPMNASFAASSKASTLNNSTVQHVEYSILIEFLYNKINDQNDGSVGERESSPRLLRW
jgi:hypothetical protein